MKISKHPSAKGTTWEYLFAEGQKLVLVLHKQEGPFIAIGWTIDGKWYYQSMMWGCRAARHTWFWPLVNFYRFIRQQKLTDHSLRYLVWGDNRLRNGGYAIRTPSLEKLVEIEKRLASSRAREREITQSIRQAITSLDLHDRWTLECMHNDLYAISEWPLAAGVRTQCITVKAIMGTIRVERHVGIANMRNEPDQFRKMLCKREANVATFNDETATPEMLVNAAIAEVQKLMAIRPYEEWMATGRRAA